MKTQKIFISFIFIVLLSACGAAVKIDREIRQKIRLSGNSTHFTSVDVDSLLKRLTGLPVRQREDSLLHYMSNGWMPAYNFRFEKISYSTFVKNNKKVKVAFWASPDYLAIGNNGYFVRMPLTPQAGQRLADKFNSVLPTTKMVDEIYKAAKIQVAPHPLTEDRDALPTFVRHNAFVQQQLRDKIPNGIVAGIKKDVVQSNAVLQNPKPDRVAIYGWHKPDGQPIQPLYTGHVDRYVDYSHGIRLVYKKMLLNNEVMLVEDVLNDPDLAPNICNDSICAAMRY